MNPDRHLSSHYDYFLDLVRGDDDNVDSHRKFYDEYNAVLDMPAEYYLDTIKVVFQDFALVNGTWEVKGQLVRPQDIETTALLTIEGELDDISGAGQTRAAHDLLHRHPEGPPVPLRRRRRRSLRHLLGPPLAVKRSTRRFVTSIAGHQTATSANKKSQPPQGGRQDGQTTPPQGQCRLNSNPHAELAARWR